MGDELLDSKQFPLGNWIQRGDIAQWWQQGLHKFAFDPVGGRYIVLGFYRTACDTTGQIVLNEVHKQSHLLGEEKVSFFGISTDLEDKSERDVEARFSSIRFLWDTDGSLDRAYGVGGVRQWIVLNPMLRVIAVIPFRPDGSDRAELLDLLEFTSAAREFPGLRGTCAHSCAVGRLRTRVVPASHCSVQASWGSGERFHAGSRGQGRREL